MGSSLRTLLTSKRSIVAMVTLAANLAVIFGLDIPPETQQTIVIVLTSLGGALIAGRSVSDHGEAVAKPRTTNNSLANVMPSDVDTGDGEVLADD